MPPGARGERPDHGITGAQIPVQTPIHGMDLAGFGATLLPKAAWMPAARTVGVRIATRCTRSRGSAWSMA